MAAAPTGTDPVAARGVSVHLGGREVVAGVDLAVAGGQVVALLGQNGAGKTTLFRALLGLMPVSSGSVILDGVDVTSASRRR